MNLAPLFFQVDAAGTSRQCLGWGQLPALVSSEDPGLLTAPSGSGSELMAPLCFCVASCRNPGREEIACVWHSLQYVAGKKLGCPHPGDRKCFWIHQFRQASGWFYSHSLVWPWEPPLSRFKTPETHLTLVCISHLSSFTASIMGLLDLPALMTL